jgi:hypothetical protein
MNDLDHYAEPESTVERARRLVAETEYVVDDLAERQARALAGLEPAGWALPPPDPAPSPVLPPVQRKAAPAAMPADQAKQWERWLAKRLKRHGAMIADATGDALAEVRTQIRAEIEANADAHRAEMAKLLVRVMSLEQQKGGWPVSALKGQGHVAA